jgi:uncharacterized protein (TIGR02271 family)
MAFR